MSRYFCIGFIGYMLADQSLADYTNLFSLHNFEKNDKFHSLFILDKYKYIK